MRNGLVVRLHNWSPQPDRFLTFGLILLTKFGWQTWRHGRDVLYFYHSHRESTSPSKIDETFMKILHARWPHVQHLIFTPDRNYDIWRMA